MLITIVLVLGSVAYACIFPYRTEVFIQMDINSLKSGLSAAKRDLTLLDNVLMIDYNNFKVSVTPEGAAIVCDEVLVDCLDNKTFRLVLQDFENWGAYDLSKEDKDTIASLYRRDTVIRKLDKKDVIIMKLKAFVMGWIGKIICTNYEEVIGCSGEWCSSERMTGDSCVRLRC